MSLPKNILTLPFGVLNQCSFSALGLPTPITIESEVMDIKVVRLESTSKVWVSCPIMVVLGRMITAYDLNTKLSFQKAKSLLTDEARLFT